MAATTAGAEPGIASDIAGGWQVATDIAAGTPRSLVSAGTTAAKYGAGLAQQYGGLSQTTAGQISGLAADVSNLANIYSGLQQGGVSGYGGAAVNAAALASRLPTSMTGLSSSSAAELGQVAMPLASALSVYNFAKGWQSGATGADALQGAQMGATIGTEILPGVGTVLGGLAGAAFGAVSSAFGGGRTSQEAQTSRSIDAALAQATDPQRADAINSMNPSNAFQMIQGYMNAHDNSPGHSEQIQQVFGTNGVNNMMSQMMPAINSAIKQNPSLANLSASQLYSQVVAPWLKSKGATIDPNTRDVHGNPEGKNLIDAITSFIGDWQSGKATSSTRLGIGGQTLNMPAYGGGTPLPPAQQQQSQQTAQQTVQQGVGSAATSLGTIFGLGSAAGTAQQQPQLGGSGTYIDNSMGWLSNLGQQTW